MHDLIPLKERARGRWREILPHFGVASRRLNGKHVPCPLCGGKDRWRFDDKEGLGTSFCNKCGSMTGVNLVMKLKDWDFVEAARAIEAVLGDVSESHPDKGQCEREAARDRHQLMWDLWRSGKRIENGDAADLYFRKRVRRYAPTRALRVVPQSSFAGRSLPAMISAFVDVNGQLCGVQRTFLNHDGRKAPALETARWNTGLFPAGGAIRLARHEAVLGIAEGVETALSASLLFNVPCWAALNAGRHKVWQPPEGVTEVIIFGDNDVNSVGQAAAYALGEQPNRTIVAQVMIPPDPGTDWNDVLQQKRHGAAA